MYEQARKMAVHLYTTDSFTSLLSAHQWAISGSTNGREHKPNVTRYIHTASLNRTTYSASRYTNVPMAHMDHCTRHFATGTAVTSARSFEAFIAVKLTRLPPFWESAQRSVFLADVSGQRISKEDDPRRWD